MAAIIENHLNEMLNKSRTDEAGLKEYKVTQNDKKFCSRVAYVSVAMIVVMTLFLVFVPIIISYSHSITCEETLNESQYKNELCNFTLLESIPENVTYPAHHHKHPSIYQGWLEMIRKAKESIDIVSFYWTLRGIDVVEDPSAVQGETIFNELLLALKRGVKVTIVTNFADPPPSEDTAILQKAGAEVMFLKMSHFTGTGILHTKMWLVDGKKVFIGSPNMDWRALTQNKEIGVLVTSCTLFVHDAAKVIATYKYLSSRKNLPKEWPCRLKTTYNLFNPMPLRVNGVPSRVVLASSPESFCPPQRTSDLSSLLHVISTARKFIYISVMDYAVSSLYTKPKRFWPVIDNALRKAALENKVEVRLMASLWNHTEPSMIKFMDSLAALNNTWAGVSVSTKLFQVPTYSPAQAAIPYARVNHNKYMVTDQAAYFTTSNWAEDYFTATAGVSIMVNQSTHATGSLRDQLEKVFERDWFSAHIYDSTMALQSYSGAPK